MRYSLAAVLAALTLSMCGGSSPTAPGNPLDDTNGDDSAPPAGIEILSTGGVNESRILQFTDLSICGTTRTYVKDPAPGAETAVELPVKYQSTGDIVEIRATFAGEGVVSHDAVVPRPPAYNHTGIAHPVTAIDGFTPDPPHVTHSVVAFGSMAGVGGVVRLEVPCEVTWVED